MKKNYLKNLLPVVTMLLCSVVASAHDFEVDGIYYNISSNEVSVTYKGNDYNSYENEYSGDVVIPETVTYNGKTYSVTSIGDDAFYSCDGLTSVTIPNSVTSIGEWAFYDCTGLTSITIPNSVTSIENYAFSRCSGLTSIVVENGNTVFDSRNNCNAIIETKTNALIFGCKNTIIPEDVTSIEFRAFSGCTGLISITIPNSVTSIGECVFYGSDGLRSVIIGNSVTSIGDEAFYDCDGLRSVIIGNSVTSIGYGAFWNCEGLTSVTIGNSVTSIGDEAFWMCRSLTSITIPNSVTSIGRDAFSGSGLTSITIPNSVTSIGYRAFSYCDGLTSITIPNSVTSIGYEAFFRCTGLKTVINLSSLTISKGSTDNGYVGYRADKVINAPNGSIEGDFVWAKIDGHNTLCVYIGNATELSLPENYKGENYVIGASAFYNCDSLTSIEIPNSVTSIGNSAFYGCSGLTSVTIPNSVTSIGSWAFSGCSSLTSITIGNSVTSIGNYAFRNCDGLTSITIGNSVTSIGSWAFDNCDSLRTVINLSSLTISKGSTDNGYVGYRADKVINAPNGSIEGDFVWAKIDVHNTLCGYIGNATELSLPENYKGENYVIGEIAFSGCSNLTSVTIGNSVTSIGDKAFYNCKKIKEIKVGKEMPISGNANIFADVVYDNAKLYIPNGTKSFYDKREPWNLFFYIIEIDFTDIDEVKGENEEMEGIYDLSGRRITEITESGLYIINGKKVLIK